MQIVDLATLTGACIIALGSSIAGLYFLFLSVSLVLFGENHYVVMHVCLAGTSFYTLSYKDVQNYMYIMINCVLIFYEIIEEVEFLDFDAFLEYIIFALIMLPVALATPQR